jgi:hypothetical protein
VSTEHKGQQPVNTTPLSSSGLVVKTCLKEPNNVHQGLNEQELQLPSNEKEDATKYAEESRATVGAREDQDVLLACLWVIPEALRMFQTNPHVLCIDGTFNTNNEEKILITFSIRDSNGKMHVVARSFVPNERAWMFRWLFQVALPSLVGKEVLLFVKICITDGDSQETSQLDYALEKIMKNAVRIRCAWHIVAQAMKKNVLLGSRKAKDPERDAIASTIRSWMYSWMQRGLENEDEYEM